MLWEKSAFVSAQETTLSMHLKEEDGPDLFATNSATTVMQVTIKSNGHQSLPGHISRSLISPHQVLLLNYIRAYTWYFAYDSFYALGLTTLQLHTALTL